MGPGHSWKLMTNEINKDHCEVLTFPDDSSTPWGNLQQFYSHKKCRNNLFLLSNITIFEKSYSFVCWNPFLKPLKDVPDVLGLSEGFKLWNLAHSVSITMAKVLPTEPALLSIRGEICFVKVRQLACSYWGKSFCIFTEGPSYDLALCLLLSLESKMSSLFLNSVKYLYKEIQKVTVSCRQSPPQTSWMVLLLSIYSPYLTFSQCLFSSKSPIQ